MRASFRLVALVVDSRSHRSMRRWRRNTWRWICPCSAAAYTSFNNDNQLDGLIDYSEPYPIERNSLEEKVLLPVPKADEFSFLSEAVVSVETDGHAKISRNRCYSSGGYDDAIMIYEAIRRTNDGLNSTGGGCSGDFSEQTLIFLRHVRGKLNKSLVIRVLKLLKNPNLCSRFFKWSGRQIGYRHSEQVYDVLLDVLGFDKNTRIPRNLLKEIGEDDREVLRRLLDVLVKKCCLNGFWNEALEELGRLKDFGYRPSQATYCSLIVVLLEANKIDSAYLVQREMWDSGHVMDYMTMGCFVTSLCKVGRWSEALSTMEKESFKPDTIIYTKMIGGLLEASLFDKAMAFLQLMRSQLCLPNSFTYNTLLSGFLKKKQFGWCKRVINMMIKEGCSPSPEQFHMLLHSYCSSGDYAYAYKLLNKMLSYGCKPPGYVAYNIFIGGICGKKCLPSNSDFQLAEKAFLDMLDAGFILNKVNIDNYTRCLCGTGNFDKAYMVIKDLISKGFVPDASTYTKVIEHLCQANKVEKSLLLFQEMKENGVIPDVYTYTILIDSFSKAGLIQQAKILFDEMIQKGCAPNVVTYTTLIHAYLKARQPSDADKLFERMLNAGCQPTVITYTALIDGLCKVGKLGKAWQVYYRMQGSTNAVDSSNYFNDNSTHIPGPNVFTYGALVDGLCKIHKADEAKNLLEVMSSAGCAPNDVVYDSFINGLCKTGKLDEAQKVLVRMSEQGYSPTVHTYTTFIDSLFKDKRLDLALKVLPRMLENSCAPNVVTYTAMIDGLCKLEKTEEAYELLLMMEEKGCKPNTVTYTAIIDGFGRVGNLEKCLDLFRQLAENGCSPNLITYRVLISHCCAYGMLDEARTLLEEMKQTYWSGNLVNYSALIQGFSREFLISVGLLQEMSKDGFEPVVPAYCFLVDNLLKSGRLEVALELYTEFAAMPFAQLTPEGRHSFYFLTETLCSIHKVDKALELYVDFSRKGGITEFSILFLLLKGLIKMGKFDETLELCHCICQMVIYWHPEDEGHHGNNKL